MTSNSHITANGSLWKWSKEAKHWTTHPRGLKCLLCPHECVIVDGKAGICHTRVNHQGKIYTIAYGNPCAIHIDPIEKKPFNHFLPGSKAFSVATAGCNLACLNCQNWSISQVSPPETRNYDLMPDQLVAQALAAQCQSIAYTYSEPISFYEYTLDSAKLAHEVGIKNVLVTAGYINDKPLREWCKTIDAASVNLKSFDDAIYRKLNRGTLDPVLNTLKAFAELGVWLEIINLVVPGWTDKLDMIKRMCGWLVENGLDDAPLHFDRFHPDYQLSQLSSTPIGVLTKARDIALVSGMKHVYIGNVPGLDAENTICPKCKQVVVERQSFTVLRNDLVNGCCRKCGEKIAGVWE